MDTAEYWYFTRIDFLVEIYSLVRLGNTIPLGLFCYRVVDKCQYQTTCKLLTWLYTVFVL